MANYSEDRAAPGQTYNHGRDKNLHSDNGGDGRAGGSGWWQGFGYDYIDRGVCSRGSAHPAGSGTHSGLGHQPGFYFRTYRKLDDPTGSQGQGWKSLKGVRDEIRYCKINLKAISV